MRKILILILFFAFFLVANIPAQSNNPKREFRGAWVATVINLDWPSSNSLNSDQQKTELINLFNKIEGTNLNAVIFQIRTECDAFYNSDYDPWSYWLTGKQGRAPSPYYDPLEFAIEEAHKRGLELHAWFNPYRVERNAGNYVTAENHVSNLHPDWIIRIGNIKFLNPGLPQVRDYVKNVVMDVVTRYNVDGVHFDDYFYPYPPDQITDEDSQTFIDYHRGFFSIDDWRRDNINELLRGIHQEIQLVKPHVKFGMSPFGIYKNGVPTGISGLDAYNTIYCDALAWLDEKIIDYLAPQLYWPFGGGQDYGKLLPWWADQVDGRHLYPGQALYRVDSWSSSEIPNQIKLNRQNPDTYGSILFRAQNLNQNPRGVTDSLNNNYFSSKALIPTMDWKDNVSPNIPTNARYEALTDARGDGILWDVPETAVDGDSASMYVVYQLNSSIVQEGDLDIPDNIWKIQGNNYATLNSSDKVTEKMYFAVTSLDDNHNESGASNVVEVELSIPEIPLLVMPEEDALNQRDTTVLTWTNSNHSSHNRLQISRDSLFNDLVVNKNEIIDTFDAVTNLDGLSKYFWRVSAVNIAGESQFSETRKFTTGFPIPPMLLLPVDKTTDISVEPTLTWTNAPEGLNYRLQVAEGLSVEPSILVVDTLISDTTIVLPPINANKIFSWRVQAGNEYGFSKWSEVSKFKTEAISSVGDDLLPLAFQLEQNYPNPFNPETVIKFSLHENGFTTLKVYDILGREVAALVNKNLSKGTYSYRFNARNLASGMYIYILRNGENISSKKMLLIK